ncbi:ABC transporter permease [Paenibacillus guangzhouensis]|uniref:ABC transporter permease n=1 Tax=Paenibacillus guangzhouensis TaxID=1473112 RepID=UPI0012673CA9|nr:ABC transporter permease [Paenibacillus guangzhouensis]
MRVIGSVSVRAFMEQIRTRFYFFSTFFICLFVIGLCYAADGQSLAILPISKGEVYLPIYILLGILFTTIVGCGTAAGKSIYRDREMYKIKTHGRYKDFALVFIGKIIGVGTAGMMQLLIIVMLSIMLLDYWQLQAVMLNSQLWLDLRHLTPSLFAYTVLFFVLGYAQYVGLYVTIGSVKNKNVMILLMLFVTALFIAMITACFYIPDVAHEMLLKVGSMFPYSAPFFMIIRLSSEDLTWFQFMMPIIIMIGAIWISNWLTIRYYVVVIRKMKKPVSLK